MYQYEICIANEYCELLVPELAHEMGVFFDELLYKNTVYERDSKSLDNIFILSNQECTVYVDCNNRDWLYGVVVIGEGEENKQIADILIRWNTKCRMEYGQKIYGYLENRYGKKDTMLNFMYKFYNCDLMRLGKKVLLGHNAYVMIPKRSNTNGIMENFRENSNGLYLVVNSDSKFYNCNITQLGKEVLESFNACVIICKKSDADSIIGAFLENTDELYLVDNPELNKFPYKYISIKKMIEYEIRKNKSKLSYDEILELLNIKEYFERFNRPWRYLGNHKWICSVALGIAKGKKVFLMPWMYKNVLVYQEYRNKQIFDAMEKLGGIVLFSVEEILKDSFMNQREVYKVHTQER